MELLFGVLFVAAIGNRIKVSGEEQDQNTKMNIKNLLLLAALMVGTGAFAQNTSTQDEMIEERVQAAISDFGLSAKQAVQYRELVKQNQADLLAMRKHQNRGDESKAKEIRDKHEADLKEILTEAQWEAYMTKKKREEQKAIDRAEQMKKDQQKKDPNKLKQSIKE